MTDQPKGKQHDDTHRDGDAAVRDAAVGRILVPYLILLASQIPLCLFYFRGLWLERPHYALLPFSFIGTALFLYLRWPRDNEPVFFPSRKSDTYLVAGIVAGVLSAFLFSPWLAFASFLCFLASLLARTNDRNIFGTLLPAIAPLVVLLQPPAAIDFDSVQGDVQLMSYVQHSSARLASNCLDLLNAAFNETTYVHNISGSRIEMVTNSFDSSHLNNGGLSLFTLLILTGLFIAWQRRPAFRASMLLLSAVFWMIVFMAIGMLICAVGHASFEKNYLDPESANRTLHLFILFGALIMTLLSDQLIAFLCGPVDISAIDEDISYQDMVCKFWNRSISGVVSENVDVNIKKEVAWAKRRKSNPSVTTASLLWIVSMAMLAVTVLHVIGVGKALVSSGKSVFSNSPDGISLAIDAMPEFEAGKFQRTDHTVEKPGVNFAKSPLHAIRDVWTYTDKSGHKYFVEIQQPFSGWHDATRELISYDWNEYQDSVESELEIAEGKPVNYESTTLQNYMAEFRVLYVVQFDGTGQSYEKPVTWKGPGQFIGRALRRLAGSGRIRAVNNRSVQVKVYSDTIREPTAEVEQNTHLFFEAIATYVANQIRSGTFGSGSAAAAPEQ